MHFSQFSGNLGKQEIKVGTRAHRARLSILFGVYIDGYFIYLDIQLG